MPTIQDIKEALEAGDVKTAEKFIDQVQAQGGISGEEKDLFAERLRVLKSSRRKEEADAAAVKTADKEAAEKADSEKKAAERKAKAKDEDSQKVAGAKDAAGKAVTNDNAPPVWQGPAGVSGEPAPSDFGSTKTD